MTVGLRFWVQWNHDKIFKKMRQNPHYSAMTSLGTTFPWDVIPLAGQGGIDTLLAWILAIATYSYMLSVKDEDDRDDGQVSVEGVRGIDRSGDE